MPEEAPQLVTALREVAYRFPGGDGLTLRVPRFEVRSGQHTAIVGPSGCGKTTLLRLISGILRPESGRVRTLDQDPSALPARARGRMRLRSIGMVFQDFALLDYLSAMENIVLTARLGGLALDEARENARSLAQRAGIEHTLRRTPDRLSQGERQRVAVCRALATRPRLIACDEPTGNLDPRRSGEIIDLILTEANTIGATVLTVTHDRGVLDAFERTTDLAEITSLGGAEREGAGR